MSHRLADRATLKGFFVLGGIRCGDTENGLGTQLVYQKMKNAALQKSWMDFFIVNAAENEGRDPMAFIALSTQSILSKGNTFTYPMTNSIAPSVCEERV